MKAVVVDKTGLSGELVFLLGGDTDDDFLDAIQAQFGLKLESAKAQVEILVIDPRRSLHRINLLIPDFQGRPKVRTAWVGEAGASNEIARPPRMA